MSENSFNFVLQIKNYQQIFQAVAKLQIKSDKTAPFGGIFYVIDQFNRFQAPVIESCLGPRVKTFGFSYSEIIRALYCIYFCGGDAIEDIKEAGLISMLEQCPGIQVPSPDTILPTPPEF